MAYTPKSKYEVLKTSGDLYKNPRTNEPYIGFYILTSEGAYTGNDITKKGQKLVLINTNPNSKVIFTPNTIRYNLANFNKNEKFINQTQPIISTKINPTKKDYQKGHYIRYFVKRNNTLNVYFEVDKNTYEGIFQSSKKYDYNLYSADKIRWALDGDVVKTNSKILLQKERTHPNISSLFNILDEFQINTPTSKTTPEQPQPQTGYTAPKTVQEQTTPFTGGGGY